MSLAIRPAAPGEAGLVLAFIRELAVYEQRLHEVEAEEAGLARDLFGPSPRVHAEIAAWDGEPCGFALWFASYSTFQGRHGVYLEDLYVRPAFRGLGIGRALMAHLARRCVAEGWGRLGFSVLRWNEPALRLYRALGAEPQDEWQGQRLSGEALRRLAGLA